MTETVEGRLFSDVGAAFWAHGPGAMSWTTVYGRDETEQHKALHLIVPGPTPDGVPLLLHVEHEDNNWAAPGPVKGWDRNMEQPTLTPSIQVLEHGEPTGWHGWLTGGRLVAA